VPGIPPSNGMHRPSWHEPAPLPGGMHSVPSGRRLDLHRPESSYSASQNSKTSLQ
jgi:hypothetical protein